mgnify:CR=1 FL=1
MPNPVHFDETQNWVQSNVKVQAQPQRNHIEYFRRSANELALPNILDDLDRLENGEPPRFLHLIDLGALITPDGETRQQASALLAARINATASGDASILHPPTTQILQPAQDPATLQLPVQQRVQQFLQNNEQQ